ncbi:MAG: motif putative anchor domain protein [Phenylobacterium sp.]|nr:motif putative anchor domain protein [Phenylobacterium sp.]
MKRTALAAFATAALAASSANATLYVVDALGNSSSGGSALSTISLTFGDVFNVSVDPNDLWNAGQLPRWSNADGLIANRTAVAGDDSGQAAGTHIGEPFPLWTQDGFTAAYGALVGRLNGQYMVLGTSFSGPAWQTGTLQLFYWDSNNGDNTQHITASITQPRDGAVPEPATWTLLIGGFGLAGAMLRRRRTAIV